MSNENNLFIQTDKLKKQAETIVDILKDGKGFQDSEAYNTPKRFVDTLIHWKRGYMDGEKFIWSCDNNIFLRVYTQVGNVSTDGTVVTVQPEIYKVEVLPKPVLLEGVDYEGIHQEICYKLGFDPWV